MAIEDNVILIGESPEETTAPEKLQPDWGNAPSLADLKNDYTEASGEHSKHTAKIDGYLDKMYLTNGEKLPASDTHSTMQPKLVRKQAEWRYAPLTEPFLNTDDIFNISPKGSDDIAAAHNNQLILNNQFNTQIDKQRLIDDYIHTGVDEGTVILRTGWEYEEETRTMSGIGPNGNVVEIEVSVPVKNQPTVEVCKYTSVIVDPTCEGDLDNAQFVIYQFDTSLSDLEKAGIYSNLDHIDSTGDAPADDDDSHYESDDSNESFTFSDESRKKLSAYEYWGYWDIDGDGVTKPIVATWVGDVLIRLEENPFPDKKVPFVSVQYLPIRRSIYGEPDCVLIEDNQKVIGAITRGMIDVMARSANGQMGSMKGALDLTNRRKFNKGEDYEFNPGTDPRTAFHMHEFPELPQSATLMLQQQQQEADNITGVRAFNNTASDLSTSQMDGRKPVDAASKRENAILRRFANGLKKVGQKILAMNHEFLSEEEEVRLASGDFVKIPREQLQGDFQIDVDISTVEVDNEKAQELAFMLQTMGNSLPMDFSQMILSEIAELRKMPALSKKIAEYTPPPPSPQEQMMQQLQMQMQQLQMQVMQMDVFKKQTEAVENQADTAYTQAKTQSEYVNQAKTQSETDNNNLEFLENQSGVSHARDVDKIQSQARAQTQMKVVEAGLEVLKDKAMPKPKPTLTKQ